MRPEVHGSVPAAVELLVLAVLEFPGLEVDREDCQLDGLQMPQ